MIQRKDWDSDFFGISIGEIAGSSPCFTGLDEYDLVQVCPNIVDDPIDVYISHGFKYVDLRMSFQKNVVSCKRPSNESIWVNPDANCITQKDIHELADGLCLFSRFSQMPIEKKRVGHFYRTWLQKALDRQFDNFSMFIRGFDEVVGVITALITNESCRIGLVAVKERYRGKGYGHMLLEAFESCLFDSGIKYVSVVTEGRNIAAQRLYQKAGFTTYEICMWLYHEKHN